MIQKMFEFFSLSHFKVLKPKVQNKPRFKNFVQNRVFLLTLYKYSPSGVYTDDCTEFSLSYILDYLQLYNILISSYEKLLNMQPFKTTFNILA